MPHLVALLHGPRAEVGGSYREVGARIEAPLETWLAAVAKLLGMAPYDLRLRLTGSPPWILVRNASASSAESWVERLRAMGCGAVQGDPGDAPFAPAPARARVGEGALVLEPDGRTLPFASLALVVRATLEQELAKESVRFSAATLDGITRHERERQRQQALYLFADDGVRARIVEGRVGLPDLPGPTVRARFDGLIATLRAGAPHATYHDRMVAEPRKRTSYRALFLDTVQRGAVQGNVEETDRAAWLLARALVEGQLA